MDEIQIKKNIRIYMFYKFFINMIIIGPIVTPFLLNKGLNYTQILSLQSVYAVTTFLFEVPTGVVADKFSRKLSLILAGIFIASGLSLYILFDNFYLLALGEIIIGIGLTFSSGADSALLFETLKGTEHEKEYSKYESKSVSYIFMGQGVGGVISSILFSMNDDNPYIMSVSFMILAMITALYFIEPVREKTTDSYVSHVFENTKNIFKSKIVLWLTLYSIFFGSCTVIGFFLYEPYFKTVNIAVPVYGVIFFVFNIIAALSAKIYSKYYSGKSSIKILLFLTVIVFLSFIVPCMFMNIFIFPFITLQQIFRAIYGPVMKGVLNRNTQDKHRATMISTMSLLSSLAYAGALPFLGMILDNRGSKYAYLVVGCIFGVFAMILFFTSIRLKKADLLSTLENESL